MWIKTILAFACAASEVQFLQLDVNFDVYSVGVKYGCFILFSTETSN